MSKIQQIQKNFPQKAGLVSHSNNYAYKQSFSGLNADEFKKAADVLEHDAKGFFGRWLQNLGLNKGEIQAQKINAAFTCTLAPLMIAFNPFSKKPKEDKEYLALRQPISAGIAIAGGIGMTMPINNYLNKLVSEGYIPSIDMRMKPDKDSLERVFKANYAQSHEGKKLPLLMSKAQKEEMSQFVADAQKERTAIFTELLTEKPEEIIKNQQKYFDKKIPGLTNTDELTAYVKENNIHNKKFLDLINEHFNLETAKDGTIKINTISKKPADVGIVDFFKKIGIIGGDIKVDEKKLIEVLGKEKVGSAIETLGKEKTDLAIDALKKLGLVDEAGKTTKAWAELINKNIPDAITELKGQKILEKVAEEISKADLKGFFKNIVNNKVAKNEFFSGQFISKWGMRANLPIAVLTCTALNWIYPRFVETFFPGLAKNKKSTPVQPEVQKGGNK